MPRINRLFKLSPVDWVMLVVAYHWLLWANRQMRAGRLVGREWLEGKRRPQTGSISEIAADDPMVLRRVRLINLAARYPRRWSWCLQSSLALRDWLAMSGVFADLRIGVRKYDGQLQAHAWLEYQGKVLNGSGRAEAVYVTLQTDRGKLLSQISKSGRETIH